MDYPRISVVIPLRVGGSAHVALDSLKGVDYPGELIETFVIEGNNPSRQRNQAISKATGKIIFFFDDDSFIIPNLFKQAVAAYEAYPEAVGVGGPAHLCGRSFFQQAAIIIFTSIFGVYKIRARYKSIGNARYSDEDELISCNLSIKNEVFEKEFGFNEALYPNEENELIGRLLKKGKKFVYDPNCVVLRKMDGSLKSFLRRIFCYGRGRIAQMRLSVSLLSFMRLVPFLFFSYLALFACLLPFVPSKLLLSSPVLIYGLMVLLFSGYNCRYKPHLFPLVFMLYMATHCAYALGEACGIFKVMLSNKKPRSN